MSTSVEEAKERRELELKVGKKELSYNRSNTNNDWVMPMSKKHKGVTFISAMAEIEYQTAIWLKEYYN